MRYLEKDGIVWQLTERKYQKFLADNSLDKDKNLDDYGRKICANLQSVSALLCHNECKRQPAAREKDRMTFEEYQEQINKNLAEISANQVRFDNGLQALLEAQASHETLIQEMRKEHAEWRDDFAKNLAEIKNTNSLLARVVLDHEDRLNRIDGGDQAA